MEAPARDEQLEALQAENARLRGALREISIGGPARQAAKRWRQDGVPSKHDTCAHGMRMYEDCGSCVAEFAAAALEKG